MDKKTFPANVPLLFYLQYAPKVKEGEYQGKPTVSLLFTFKCADNRHPDLVGAPYWVKTSTWVSYLNADRETKLTTLLRSMTGDNIPDAVYGTDAKDWDRDEWRPFTGYYGVTFGKPNEKGFQDHLALLPASSLGLDVDKLKAEIPKWEGKKDSESKPEQKPDPVLGFPQELVLALLAYWKMGGDWQTLIKAFSAGKKVTDMDPEVQKHLYVLCVLQDMLVNGQTQAAVVTSHLKGRSLHTVPMSEALAIWVATQNPFGDEDVPF